MGISPNGGIGGAGIGGAGIGSGGISASVSASFSPSSLFSAGEDGDYWDATDASSLTEFATGDPVSQGSTVGGFSGQLGAYNYDTGLVGSPARTWNANNLQVPDGAGLLSGVSALSLPATSSWSAFCVFTAKDAPGIEQIDLFFTNQQGSGLHFGGLEFTSAGHIVYKPTDNAADDIVSSAAVTDGELHTAGYIHDAASDSFTLLVDGVVQGEVSTPAGTPYSVNGMYIAMGDNPAGATISQRWHWKQLFIGRALTLSEAQALSGWLLAGNLHKQATTVTAGGAVSTDQDAPVVGSFTHQNLYGSTPVFSVSSGPVNGGAVVSGDQYTYTPDSGFSGADQFGFVASADGTASPEALIDVTVVPEPQVIFYDTFTSAALENLASHTPNQGSGWGVGVDVTAEVSGGELRAVTSVSAPDTCYIADAVPTAHTVKFQVGATPGVTGCVVRRQDEDNYIGVQYRHSSGLLYIVQIFGGGYSQLAGAVQTLGPSDIVEVTDDGTNVTVYVNGVEKIPAETITNFAANPAAGVYVAGVDGRLTSFAAVDAVQVTNTMP